MEIISRQAAAYLGFSKFFTGVPCIKRGHISERYVNGGRCVSCAIEQSRRQSLDGKKKPGKYNKEKKAAYYAKNKEAIKNRRTEKAAAKKGLNVDQYVEWLRSRRSDPEKAKEKRRKYGRSDYQRNADRYKAHSSARKRGQRCATPPWADFKEIRRFYCLAERLTRTTGVAHHVDHVVPLKSELVCGLHTQHNLRVITASDNLSKGNSFDPDKHCHELP